MSRLRVGFIGTGRKPERPGPQGFGMSHQHAQGYADCASECQIVACADIVPENAEAFAKQWGVPSGSVYARAEDMLAAEHLDLVSIPVWPRLHRPLVMQAAEAGVRAIFCEKPMADTWEACRRMAAECERRGVRLAFNHQRRFGRPFRGAKEILDSGRIGQLVRVEFGTGNLYDYGSHSFDLSCYFAGEQAARWVIAQIDYRTERVVFGTHNENQAYVLWQYPDGVYGVASTGEGADLIGCHNRLVGSEGEIEIGRRGKDMPVLRHRRFDGGGWQAVDCGAEGVHGPGYVERAVADVVGALREERETELCARNALHGTELIFASWESARRRARIDLPLTIDDNPLEAMVAAGELRPQPAASA